MNLKSKEQTYNSRYANDKEGKTRILGEKFVKNNKNKCEIFYKEKSYELIEFIDEIDSSIKNNDMIKLTLKINKYITNFSYMFNECKT